MAERALDRPNCYSAFRLPSLRAVDYRWVRAHEIYETNRREYGSVSQLAKREVWNSDPVITRLVRARVITAGGSLNIDPSEVRPSDIETLAAIDCAVDSANAKVFHKLQCYFLGGANDDVCAKLLGTDNPKIPALIHDAFYDVRSRIEKASLISSLVFPMCFSRGGLSNPMDEERILAWAFGYELYEKATSIQHIDEDIRSQFIQIMTRNQEVTAMLRRGMGQESIEAIAATIHDRSMAALKAAPPDAEGAGVMRKLTAGLSRLGVTVGGAQVADEDVLTSRRVERPQVMDKLQPAPKEPQHVPA
jgi:hypothetical protein